MAIRQVLKISRKTFFNPSGWLDYAALKEQNRTIISVLGNLFARPATNKQETFAQAMQRLHLKEEDIESTKNNYRVYALIFLVLSLLSFFYTFYLLFRYHSLLDWLLGMGVTGLFVSQAFKYDFWALQLRQRKLGLTFADWKKATLGTKDNTK